jgi:hypothetical protein
MGTWLAGAVVAEEMEGGRDGTFHASTVRIPYSDRLRPRKSARLGMARETPSAIRASKMPAIFARYPCFVAILLNFIDNTGTVQLRPSGAEETGMAVELAVGCLSARYEQHTLNHYWQGKEITNGEQDSTKYSGHIFEHCSQG